MGFLRHRTIRGQAATIVFAAALSLLVTGISSPAVSAAGPTITILSPANNSVIGNGTPIAVAFVTSDFNLTEPGTGSAGPNVGHAEVYLDGTLFAVTSEQTITMDVESGLHDIRVRLVADNGSALIPDVSSSITVTSTQGPASGTPGIRITFPLDGADRGPDTAISYTLTNFALVPPGAAPNVPNEGHVEVFLDGNLYQELTEYEPAHFSDVPNGLHNATLRLVDSAHQPLTPDVSDGIEFRVTAAAIVDISPELGLVNLGLAAAVVAVLYYPIRRRKE